MARTAARSSASPVQFCVKRLLRWLQRSRGVGVGADEGGGPDRDQQPDDHQHQEHLDQKQRESLAERPARWRVLKRTMPLHTTKLLRRGRVFGSTNCIVQVRRVVAHALPHIPGTGGGGMWGTGGIIALA